MIELQVAQNHQQQTAAWERWRVLLLAMGCYLFYYTGRQNFGFAVPGLREDLGLSPSQIGTLSAAMLLAYGVGQAINGGLGDRFGARALVALGAVASTALNWATSFASGFGALLVLWTLNGYAQSFGWAPSCRLIANWWPVARRGTAYGLFVWSAGFSSVLTFGLSLLVLSFSDWRGVFRYPVLLLGAAGVLFFLMVKNAPGEADAEPGEEGPESDGGAQAVPRESAAARYRAVLRDRRFLIATFALGCESIARYGLLYWVPVRFLGDDWRTNPGNAWVTLALPLGMAAGAACTGWVSDTLFSGDRVRPIIAMLGLAALTTGALAFVTTGSIAVSFTLLVLAGFLVYGPQSAFWALASELAGRSRAGTAIGIMDAAAYGFAAAGEVLIGYAIETSGSTAAVFYVVPAVCVAGAAAMLLPGGFQRGRFI